MAKEKRELEIKVSDLKPETVQKMRDFMGDAWKEEMHDVTMFIMAPPTPESRVKRRIAQAIIDSLEDADEGIIREDTMDKIANLFDGIEDGPMQ